ncbi:SRPBCC family protein [Sulfurisphaera ohwakuensis]|uniref:SRPBCC family protein n=1 Tax=Sulfurisphaera ohwakuensis TaxID=69656 RepID=A0A650CF45_SULOH|nr:SRPBCC family protein [Sulfurisphaera ohwakuensis]MBB5254327.1 hypothetical protein [Sulfurisphaera ohwakuensis]QGR16424.1 SRPBCC family protein [Sulfurisphaera ohwakuensis]
MIRFTICKDVEDEDKIWEIIRDPYKIPNYWKGTRELNIREVSKNIYEGEVRFAFPAKGKVKIEVDDNSRRITISYLSGPVKGKHEIEIKDKKICSNWNVELSLLFRFREKWTEEHFRSGTIHALERIVSEK